MRRSANILPFQVPTPPSFIHFFVQIDEFVAAQTAGLSAAAADHEATMRALEAKAAKLGHDEERAAARAAELRGTLAAEKRSLSDRTAELFELKVQSQALPVEVDAVKAAEAEARTQLDVSKAGK